MTNIPHCWGIFKVAIRGLFAAGAVYPGLIPIHFQTIVSTVTYVTIEAEILESRIVPSEGAQLPERGRALVTLLPEAPRLPNWEAVETFLGVLRRPALDSGTWQREIRAEWDGD